MKHPNHMYVSWSTLAAALLALVVAGCGKEVCKEGTGPVFEVKVIFDGLNDRAAVLEFDSRVYLDQEPPNSTYWDYATRRIGRMAFPESARDGSETFVFDPGRYARSLIDAAVPFDYLVFIRVYDNQGLLLAEGRYRKSASTGGCYLSQTVHVSASGSCKDKEEGDLCPVRNGTVQVCREAGNGLTCQDSTCGDGYVDSQAGEMCDPGMSGADLECGQNCLPLPVHRTLWNQTTSGEPRPGWFEVRTTTSPPPRERAAGAVMGSGYLLFGGRDQDGVALGDTWRYDGSDWVPEDVGAAAPAPRWGHVMTYFPTEDKVVLFGGTDVSEDSTTVATFNDLWVWDAQHGWEQVSAAGDVPPPLHSAALAYIEEGSGQQAMLFGGMNGEAVISNGLYLLSTDGSGSWTWTQKTISGVSPGGRYGHSLSPFPGRSGALILAGGQSSTAVLKGLYEVHPLDATPFATLIPDGSCNTTLVSCGSFRQMVPLPGTSKVLVYGGRRSPEQGATSLGCGTPPFPVSRIIAS